MEKIESVDQDRKEKIELSSDEDTIKIEEKSQGVARIEAISSSYTKVTLWILLFGIFLVSTAYGLDGGTRSVYQATAADAFKNHSLISTLNVVHAVASAAIQPPLSIAANVFGRIELISFAVVLYVVGTIVEATSNSIKSYAGGQVLWTLGMRAFQLMFEVMLADFSSTRNRVLYSYIPALPFLFNAWISGNVTSSVLSATTWQWAVGMWAIIIPVVSIPIYLTVWLVTRKAKKQGKLDNIKPTFAGRTFWENIVILFWQFDVVGILLIAAILSLLLIPLTIAGGTATRWAHGDVISMLVIGFLCIPAFVFWELKYAKHPCVPFRLLNNRGVLACLAMAFLLNVCWYLQGDYLYTVLMVSFDESTESATRIASLYSFTSVIVGLISGFIIRYIRRIKWVAVSGTLAFTLALGLMIKYRSSADNGNIGVIAAQVVLGVGGGLFPYPVQALIQFETKHEHMAVITALYLTTYQIGAAVGNSISGAIWTNTLPGKLAENYASFTNATDLVSNAYGSPLTFILDYPMGTPERMALVNAYEYTQKLLTITGCCFAVPLILAALLLRDPVLGDTQSLPNAEENSEKSNN